MQNKAEYIRSLELDQQGDWDKAHKIVQDINTEDAAWIHAYLHRKEGDEWNAGYWYRRAGRPFFNGTLEQEWNEMMEYFSR